MRKIVRINESQLIYLIESITSEIPTLKYSDFTELSKSTYELVDTPNAIELQGKYILDKKPSYDCYNKLGKNEFEVYALTIKFLKYPENSKYKIMIIGHCADKDPISKFALGLLDQFDTNIINYFKKLNVDFANDQSKVSRGSNDNDEIFEYFVDLSELDKFKEIILECINKFPV
jgi:hypothetical protein